MNSRLRTKSLLITLMLLFVISLDAQDDNGEEEINEQTLTRQRFAAFNLGYKAPIPTGDNFIGKGLKGKGGVDFRFQLYPYKQFFVGIGLGTSYFTVKNPQIVGNYKKTTLTEQYLYIGYEFLPLEKIRIGLLASVIGDARYKNKYYLNEDDAYQIDHSRLGSYGLYLNYEIGGNFMLYIDYAYRTGKTKIRVPQELEDTFGRGSYHNIGIGLTFVMGTNDFASRLFN